jgi:hypothetical protein
LWIEISFPLIHSCNNNKVFLKIIVLILLVLIQDLKKIVFEKQLELLEYCGPDPWINSGQKDFYNGNRNPDSGKTGC